MKNKKLILIIMILLLVGCGKSNNLTADEKLKQNKYELVNDGNYLKEIDDNNSYFINLLEDIKYFIINENNIYQIYFFEDDWGSLGNCDYNFKNKQALYGTTCSDEEIDKLNQLKKKFNKELQTIDITIEDLVNLNKDENEN